MGEMPTVTGLCHGVWPMKADTTKKTEASSPPSLTHLIYKMEPVCNAHTCHGHAIEMIQGQDLPSTVPRCFGTVNAPPLPLGSTSPLKKPKYTKKHQQNPPDDCLISHFVPNSPSLSVSTCLYILYIWNLLYSTGSSAGCCVMTQRDGMGGGEGGRCKSQGCMHIWLIHLVISRK